VYGRVTGSGDSCSPPLHSSVRENYGSFRFAVLPLMVYGPLRSTHNASNGLVIASLVGSFPYLNCLRLFT
jgi:hypothetical protein